jgi:hypothetical protein
MKTISKRSTEVQDAKKQNAACTLFKKVHFNYFLIFFLLFTINSVSGQTHGDRWGNHKDTFIINQNKSNHIPVIRLQDKYDGWLLSNENNELRFNWAGNTKFWDYGQNKFRFRNNGELFATGSFTVQEGNGKGFKLWNSDSFKIHMGYSDEYHFGPVTTFGIKTNMSPESGRGWVWGGQNQTPIAALSNKGVMQLAEAMAIGGNLVSGTALTVDGRVYISENGGSEKGFSNKQDDNYKDYLLWVEEGIVSADFAIATLTDWPDYVFNKNYKLPSLKDVEKNIKEKGHLHTMPSAKQVEKNGFTVKDMTKRMVKTIEELTLHTIAQEKQIEAQNTLMKALSKRLEKLEAQAIK